jgi:hypothetical protein
MKNETVVISIFTMYSEVFHCFGYTTITPKKSKKHGNVSKEEGESNRVWNE